jgi:hypothetical protein
MFIRTTPCYAKHHNREMPHITYGGVLGLLRKAIAADSASAYFSANSSILGISSAMRKGFDTTSSYKVLV